MKYMSIHLAAEQLGWNSTRDFTTWCRENGVEVRRMSHKKIVVSQESLEAVLDSLPQ